MTLPYVSRLLLSSLVVTGGVAMQACGSPHSTPAPAETRDSADVVIVTNGEPQWRAGEAWTVATEPVRTIGVLDGDERYQFFNISSAARQSDGDVVVADIGTRTIRLYDRAGAFTRTIGGPGSGPGEFRAPTQVMVQAGDSILVWDDVLLRLTRFDSSGEFAGVQTVSREEIAKSVTPPLYPGTAKLLNNGELWFRLIEKPLLKGTTAAVKKGGVANPDPDGAWYRRKSGALRVSPDLSHVDTVMLFDDIQQVMLDAPWGSSAVVPPLAVNTTIAVQPNAARACIGDQARPEISCFAADGSHTVVRWPSQPVAVEANEDEVTAWREATIEQYALKMARDEASRFVATIPVPAMRPEYSGILLDHAGNLWVRRGPAGRGGSEAIEYFVFGPVGAFLGALFLPPIRVLEIGTDYVMGVYQDEFNVEYIGVFEIMKPTV